MKKTALSVREIVLIGIFTALLAVLSQVAVPISTGVPLTLQTFAVSLCGFTLCARRGAVSVMAYLLMGAMGLPVFANFKGGLIWLAGPTGGFLIGFVFLAVFSGMPNPWLSSVGLFICHLLGALQYSIVSGVAFSNSALTVSLPYLLKDAMSVFAAWVASGVIKGRVAELYNKAAR